MNIDEKVISVIQANIEAGHQVALTSDLRRDLRLDSFGTLMVVNALEEAFGVSVQDVELAQVRTVADVARLVRTKCDPAIKEAA